MVDLTFDSTDLDSATSESGVVHESTTDTDHNDASNLKQGYPYGSFGAITPTPILATPLHEDSGSTANDLSGNNNDGTVNGPTTGVAGLLGTTAYDFDGTDDLVEFGTVPVTDFTGSYTVSWWINPDTKTNTPNPRVIDKGVGTSNDGGYRAFIRNDGDIRWDHATGFSSNVSLKSTSGAATSEWQFWTVVFDSANSTLAIYLNGTKDNTKTGVGDPVGASNTLVYGGRDDGGDTYDGTMAGVRFYDTALTASQVQTLYDLVAANSTLTTGSKTV